ncbi:hypothetical protein IscW_ISCW016171 [Ixodes scapularis]|uniref:C2H2-type domain-containing protein n=1 Tax=Ixodes scapularis TaxID=6945 RepID=B7P7A6_IXOSC|nr:hypothetical protein IscW_ISCW016171 [Ixodes scapularis]|eukprot:XP_002409945.1 hypothetical protein IscW_ISCW016171 [Ixodes scapularis]
MAAVSAAPTTERCEAISMDSVHFSPERLWRRLGDRRPSIAQQEFLRFLGDSDNESGRDAGERVMSLVSCWATLTSWYRALPYEDAARVLSLETFKFVSASSADIPEVLKEELLDAITSCCSVLGPMVIPFSSVCDVLLTATTSPGKGSLLKRLLDATDPEACILLSKAVCSEGNLLNHLECLRFWEQDSVVEALCREQLARVARRGSAEGRLEEDHLDLERVEGALEGQEFLEQLLCVLYRQRRIEELCTEVTVCSEGNLLNHLECLRFWEQDSVVEALCREQLARVARGVSAEGRSEEDHLDLERVEGALEGQEFLEQLLCVLYRQRRIEELCTETSQYTCHQAVQLIRGTKERAQRMPGQRDSERLDVAEALAHVFLVRDLLVPSPYCCTRDLMGLWCELQALQGHRTGEVARAALRLVVPHAATSAHFYLFSDVLWEHFGLRLLPVYLDFFVRGLTTDINTMQNALHRENWPSVREMEIHLSNVYLKLSTLFSNSPLLCRECVLSAFALDPTEERLEQLNQLTLSVRHTEEMAGPSHEPGERNGRACRCGGRCMDEPVLQTTSSARRDGRPEYEMDFWHPVLELGLSGVPYLLLKDFRKKEVRAQGKGPGNEDALAEGEGGPSTAPKDVPRVKKKSKKKGSHRKKEEEGAPPPVPEASSANSGGCLESLRVILERFDRLSGVSDKPPADGTSGPCVVPSLSLPNISMLRLDEKIEQPLPHPLEADQPLPLPEGPLGESLQRVMDAFQSGLAKTPLKRFLKFQTRRPTFTTKKAVPVKVSMRTSKSQGPVPPIIKSPLSTRATTSMTAPVATIVTARPIKVTRTVVSGGTVKPTIIKSSFAKATIAKANVVGPSLINPDMVQPSAIKASVVKTSLVKPSIVKATLVKSNAGQVSAMVTGPAALAPATAGTSAASTVCAAHSEFLAPVTSVVKPVVAVQPPSSPVQASLQATIAPTPIAPAPIAPVPIAPAAVSSVLAPRILPSVQPTPVLQSPQAVVPPRAVAIMQKSVQNIAPQQPTMSQTVPRVALVTTTAAATLATSCAPQMASCSSVVTTMSAESAAHVFSQLKQGQATVLRVPVYSRAMQQGQQGGVKSEGPGVCMLPMKFLNAAMLSGQDKVISIGNQKIAINSLPNLIAAATASSTGAATMTTTMAGTVVSSSGGGMMTAKMMPAMVAGGQNVQQMLPQMVRLNTLGGGIQMSGANATVLSADQLAGQPGMANLAALTVPLQGGLMGGRVIAGKIMIPVNSLLQQGATLSTGTGMPMIILKNQPSQAKIMTDLQANGSPVVVSTGATAGVPLAISTTASSNATIIKKTWMPIRSKPGAMEYRKVCNMPPVKVTRAKFLAPVSSQQLPIVYTSPQAPVSVTSATRVVSQPMCKTIPFTGMPGVTHLTVPTVQMGMPMTVVSSSSMVGQQLSVPVAPKVVTRQVTVPIAKLLQKPTSTVYKVADGHTPILPAPSVLCTQPTVQVVQTSQATTVAAVPVPIRPREESVPTDAPKATTPGEAVPVASSTPKTAAVPSQRPTEIQFPLPEDLATIKECQDYELDYWSDDSSNCSVEDLFEEKALLRRLEHEEELNSILYVSDSVASEPDCDAFPWSSQSSMLLDQLNSDGDARDTMTPSSVADSLAEENGLQSPSKFSCDRCRRGFFSAYNLRRHQKNVHKMEFKSFHPSSIGRDTPSPQHRPVPLSKQPVAAASGGQRRAITTREARAESCLRPSRTEALVREFGGAIRLGGESAVRHQGRASEHGMESLICDNASFDVIQQTPLDFYPEKRDRPELSLSSVVAGGSGGSGAARSQGRKTYGSSKRAGGEGGGSPEELSKNLDPADILESLEVAKMSGWSSANSPLVDAAGAMSVKLEFKDEDAVSRSALESLLGKAGGVNHSGGEGQDDIDDIQPTVQHMRVSDGKEEDEGQGSEPWNDLSADQAALLEDIKAVESLAEYGTDSLDFFVAPRNVMTMEDQGDLLGFADGSPPMGEDPGEEGEEEEDMAEAHLPDGKMLSVKTEPEEEAKPCTSHCRTRARETSIKRSCPCCEDSSPRRRLTRSSSSGGKTRSSAKKVRTR